MIERIEVSVSAAKANEWIESRRMGYDTPVEHAFEKDWYINSINFSNGVYTATLVSCRRPTALEIVSQWRNN
jgi:hypothetical protein